MCAGLDEAVRFHWKKIEALGQSMRHLYGASSNVTCALLAMAVERTDGLNELRVPGSYVVLSNFRVFWPQQVELTTRNIFVTYLTQPTFNSRLTK